MRHQRSVTWIREDLPRDQIPQDLLYSLGAFLTVVGFNGMMPRRGFGSLDDQPQIPPPGTPTSEQPATDTVPQADIDLDELSRDQIRRRLSNRFSGPDLARLGGAVLEAQGLLVQVSPPRPDGVDILAGEGGTGFDGVALAVQVKPGGVVVDAPTLRELQGVIGNVSAARGLMARVGGLHQDRPSQGASPFLPAKALGRRRRDPRDGERTQPTPARDPGGPPPGQNLNPRP